MLPATYTQLLALDHDIFIPVESALEKISTLIPSGPVQKSSNAGSAFPFHNISSHTCGISRIRNTREGTPEKKANNHVRAFIPNKSLQPELRPHSPPKRRHGHRLVRDPLDRHGQRQRQRNLGTFLRRHGPMLRHQHRPERRWLRVVLLPGLHGEEQRAVQSGFRRLLEEGGDCSEFDRGVDALL